MCFYFGKNALSILAFSVFVGSLCGNKRIGAAHFFVLGNIKKEREVLKVSKRPHLEELDYLFDGGANIQISSKEYEAKTGASLPKGEKYLRYDSALAKMARERGYVIVDVRAETIPERTVIFKRKA